MMLEALASDWPALAIVAVVIGYMAAVTWKALSTLSRRDEKGKNDDGSA